MADANNQIMPVAQGTVNLSDISPKDKNHKRKCHMFCRKTMTAKVKTKNMIFSDKLGLKIAYFL